MTVYLTDDEVADRLKVEKRTIQRLANAGDLAGFKVGKHWRFTEQAVLEFTGEAAAASPVPPELAGIHPSSLRRVRRRAA